MVEYVIGFLCGAAAVFFTMRVSIKNAVSNAYMSGAANMLHQCIEDGIVLVNPDDPRGVMLGAILGKGSVIEENNNGND